VKSGVSRTNLDLAGSMGASESKPIVLPVRGPETHIKFSNEVLAQLSSSLAETTPTPEREQVLDSHVRARVREEVAHLQEQEAEVRNEIARALEKENLRTEGRIASSTSHDENDGTVVASSASLREDVEEVRRRVERFQKRWEELGVHGAESAREGVVKCYKDHPKRPLDCWREVEEFRKQVSALEQRFVNSLR